MSGRRHQGFTLVELLTVLLLMGILSAIAIPRMASRQSMDAVGYFDQVRQTLQYGRRLAVAQRRNVCVVVTPGSGLSLSQASVEGSGAACVTGVMDPATGSAVNLALPPGISLAGSSFQFDSLGRQGSGSVITLSVAGDGLTRLVTVENETGYVH